MEPKLSSNGSVGRVNRLVLGITAPLYLIMLVAYCLEAYRGAISWYIPIGIVIISIISLSISLYLFRRNNDSPHMRLFTAAGSVALVVLAFFATTQFGIYAITLVLTLPYVLYFDFVFTAVYGGIMLLVSFSLTAHGIATKPNYLGGWGSALTTFAFVSISQYIVVISLTRLATSLNAEKIQQITEVADFQDETLQSMMQIASSIQANTLRGEQIGEKLNDDVYQVSQLLQNIATNLVQRGDMVIVDMQQSTDRLHSDTEAAVRTMNSLQEACARIASTTQLISSIAMQTNLLSLNAAVESARVGEAGKGFAVVADEVKQLAEKSRQSAEEIDAIVRSLQIEASEAMHSMEQVKEITDMISVVSQSSQEVLSEIGASISEVYRLVNSVTHSVEEVAEANHSLSMEAEQLIGEDQFQEEELDFSLSIQQHQRYQEDRRSLPKPRL